MTAARWTLFALASLLLGVLGVGVILTPGVLSNLPALECLILLALGIIASGCAFFAGWMQLFLGGSSGIRILAAGFAAVLAAWVLLWGILPVVQA